MLTYEKSPARAAYFIGMRIRIAILALFLKKGM